MICGTNKRTPATNFQSAVALATASMASDEEYDVFVSHAYKAELNGLFQVETINGKTILPIWHNLTKKQVVEYSPIIADRKAMTTASMTPKEIAAELKRLFAPDNTEG